MRIIHCGISMEWEPQGEGNWNGTFNGELFWKAKEIQYGVGNGSWKCQAYGKMKQGKMKAAGHDRFEAIMMCHAATRLYYDMENNPTIGERK